MSAPVAFAGRTAARATRWSAVSVFGRQLAQVLFAVVLARIIGPEEFGLVSAATVYATLTALLLDQGLSAALVQRRDLPEGAGRAVATLNVVVALVLGGLTWVLAPALADFFSAPELSLAFRVLGAGLVLKALAVAPRALLSRALDFRPVAVGDVAGAVCGVAVGLGAAFSGAGYTSVLAQVLTTDAVVAAVLLVAARGPLPGASLGPLRVLLPFSARVFGANAVAYFSRNTDNVLVGKVLGLEALAQYAMAYRVLVIPVQLLGQTVKRTLFPAFSRMADDPPAVARALVAGTELVALLAVPVMALVACAAPEAVDLVLGPAWAPAAPVMTVLALAGARETVFYITPSLVSALGRAGTTLRLELVSTGVQVVGIVAGLPFGILGVAVGYATAGLLMTPVFLAVQRRVTGVTVGAQLRALAPAATAAAAGSVAYLAVAAALTGTVVTLAAGSLVFVVVALAALRVVHPAAAKRATARLREVAR
ncbi:lipopolysaccharide biosynthesis protein [Streptomyces sp. NP160]|uniref:lipopolysaccharide biosynthesis protein n=1 Tax=Streptomyces sp. NP160 TaxID=2586637 RepID=UPI0015D588DD|nr:lipopolysaccharide biosynthesis protein [Streptomyces sp. NP160]